MLQPDSEDVVITTPDKHLERFDAESALNFQDFLIAIGYKDILDMFDNNTPVHYDDMYQKIEDKYVKENKFPNPTVATGNYIMGGLQRLSPDLITFSDTRRQYFTLTPRGKEMHSVASRFLAANPLTQTTEQRAQIQDMCRDMSIQRKLRKQQEDGTVVKTPPMSLKVLWYFLFHDTAYNYEVKDTLQLPRGLGSDRLHIISPLSLEHPTAAHKPYTLSMEGRKIRNIFLLPLWRVAQEMKYTL